MAAPCVCKRAGFGRQKGRYDRMKPALSGDETCPFANGAFTTGDGKQIPSAIIGTHTNNRWGKLFQKIITTTKKNVTFVDIYQINNLTNKLMKQHFMQKVMLAALCAVTLLGISSCKDDDPIGNRFPLLNKQSFAFNRTGGRDSLLTTDNANFRISGHLYVYVDKDNQEKEYLAYANLNAKQQVIKSEDKKDDKIYGGIEYENGEVEKITLEWCVITRARDKQHRPLNKYYIDVNDKAKDGLCLGIEAYDEAPVPVKIECRGEVKPQ